MLHSPEVTPLSDFISLSEREQFSVLQSLQVQSIQQGDKVANVRLLFAEALQVVASLSPSLVLSDDAAAAGVGASGERSNTPDDIKKHEETTSNYLNALILFNAAFEQAKEIPTPITMIDDYVFVRAVYTRLHRVQAAISLRVAEDVERDLRQFARLHENEHILRPAHFNAIMSRAFEAVPPPDENYWSQFENIKPGTGVDDLKR